MSLNISIQTAEECLRIAHILQGHAQALEDEKKSVVGKVESAKKWIARQPDYLKFLQHLQNALHQKNIGAFSELLSYFVKDVLKKDKEIVLDLYTYHNLPALKIEALNDGCRESIYEGNGGSIANIVSTGLRLIALSRLSHRKFIVLDEPDCWLKPDHVPTFAKIIGEISEKLKIQTIIISHHDWKYFKDYGRVIELQTDGKNLQTSIVHDTEFEDKPDADYIRSIRLRQFMSHYDTVFELHPYLTCLIGENDIGKSVLATAIKSVSYNDSSDSYIQHHTDEAQVLIELNQKRQILWQRFRVTTQENPQKVKYSLFVNGQLISSEFNSNEVPKFISKELNIVTTEDIDIHIGNQKQPVFLLSSDVKPQERAKILSLGKESLIIQKMMENIKVKTRQNKQIIKDGEERFDIVNKQLQVLANIESLVEKAEDNKTLYFALEKQAQSIESLNSLVSKIEAEEDIIKVGQVQIDLPVVNLKDCSYLELMLSNLEKQYDLMNVQEIDVDLPVVVLNETVDLERAIKHLYVCEQGANIESIEIEMPEVQLHKIDELQQLIANLEQSEKITTISQVEHLELEQVQLKDVAELSSLIEQLEMQETELNDLNSKKQNLNNWETIINNEIEVFLKENGNMCPTCHQVVDKKHFGGLHA